MRGIHTRQNGIRAAMATLILAVTVTAGAVGCSAASDKSSAPAARDNAAGAPAPGLATAEEQATGDSGATAADKAAGKATTGTAATGGKAPTEVTQTERSIIYTGSITLRVSNVDEAAAKATAVATGSGGSVSGDQRSIDATRSQATLILRIPAERFTSVLDQLHSTLGKEETRNIQAQDVTDQVVDLDARIETAQASLERVRALMTRAQTLSEIVSLESELSRRESDLNSLLRRKSKLSDLASLSTITVVLLGPNAKVTEPKPEESGFVTGFKGGWHAFVASLGIVATIIGALLPWMIAIGLPVALIVLVVRRRNRRRSAATPRPAPLAGPAAPKGPAAPSGPAAPAGPESPMAPMAPAAPGDDQTTRSTVDRGEH